MAAAERPDPVDRLVDQWAVERPDLVDELGAMATFGRIGRLHALAGRAIEAVFEAHGLNVGEFDVLAALRREGDPFVLTPTALARTLMLSPAGMTNRVDRLEARGLVERQADPDDRRSLLVALTPDGRATVDAAVADHVANEERLLSVLAAHERSSLDRIVRKLVDQFSEDNPSGGSGRRNS
jgi:DNA-binding MarR family transcriptional regulator